MSSGNKTVKREEGAKKPMSPQTPPLNKLWPWLIGVSIILAIIYFYLVI